MASNVDILNAIRNDASVSFATRIPQATQSNLNQIATTLATHTETKNEFLDKLVNKICMQIITNKEYTNPLKVLKKGSVQYGKDIEHVVINPSVSKEYTIEANDLLAVVKPDVKSVYYTVNSCRKYEVTITTPKMIQAITTEGGLNQMVNMIVGSLYSGDEMDEFQLTKQLVNLAVNSNNVLMIDLDYDINNLTSVQSHDLVKMMKLHSKKMEFPSTQYNCYDKVKATGETDLITWSKKENQVILIDSAISTSIDVDVLANAFNLSKADYLARRIEVDSFGDSNVFAIICDESWFQIRDNLYNLETDYNASNMARKYFLHHWQSFSYSLLSNALVLRKKPTAIK